MRNGGNWTESRFRQFVVGALRQAHKRWRPKYERIEAAFVGKHNNPATGRMRKMYRCECCQELFPQKDMRADHVEPVVDPETGFVDWNTFIERMFVEFDGYSAICIGCHQVKSAHERELRRNAN